MSLDSEDRAGASERGRAHTKAGRSSDQASRQAEPDQGFPPGVGMRWRLFDGFGVLPPGLMRSVAQKVLARPSGRGLAEGGEFCDRPPDDVRRLVDGVVAPDSSKQSFPLPTRQPPANPLCGLGKGTRTKHV